MSDQKISELTALTGANVADDDAIAIVDTSATETKKIVFSELKNALDTATGFVRITGDTMTGALTTTGLTSSGNLLVNVTSAQDFTSTTTNGHTLYGGSVNAALHSRNDANALAVQRTGTDGSLVNFFKATAEVGSIGTVGSDIVIGSGNTGIRFYESDNSILPSSAAGQASDGSLDIGDGSFRFKDLYLSGGVYLGGTGSANKLDDYEEGQYDATITCGTSGTITLDASYNRASYVKVGSLVHVQGLLIPSAVSSPTGYFGISLPFTVENLTDRAGDSSGSILVHASSANVRDYVCMINEGLNKLLVYLGDGTSRQEDSANAISSGVQINFQCSYRTT